MGADFLCSFSFPTSIFLIVDKSKAKCKTHSRNLIFKYFYRYHLCFLLRQKTDNVEKPKLEQIPGGNLWQLRLAALLTGVGGEGPRREIPLH